MNSLLHGCQAKDEPLKRIMTHFKGAFLEVEAPTPDEFFHWVELYRLKGVRGIDCQKIFLKRIDFHGAGSSRERIFWRWKAGQRYFVRGRTSRRDFHRHLKAPSSKKSVSVLLELPYGWPGKGTLNLVAGGGVRATILLENHGKKTHIVSLHLNVPTALLLKKAKGWNLRNHRKYWQLRRRITLEGDGERWVDQLSFSIPAKGWRRGELSLKASICPQSGPQRRCQEQERTLHLAISNPKEVAKKIEVVGVDFPTDSEGRKDGKRVGDELFISGGIFEQIRSFLGIRPPIFDGYTPTHFQAITLKNRTNRSIQLVISSVVLEAKSERRAEAFKQPFKLYGREGQIVVFAFLGGNQARKVVLPMLIDRSKLKAGLYRRKLTIRIWGSERVLATIVRPLRVHRPPLMAWFWAFLSFVISLGLLAWIIRKFSSFLKGFHTHSLMVIALFASTSLVLIVPTLFFAQFFQVLLGPFAGLVTGIFFDTMQALLLALLLTLIPRNGVILLLFLVRFLLGAVMLGQFSLASFLHTAVMIVLVEGALWLAGVTRGHRLPFEWLAIFFFASAHALSLFLQYQLGIAFYRLFFANWFLYLSVALNGFLYPAVGFLLSRHLALSLKKFYV